MTQTEMQLKKKKMVQKDCDDRHVIVFFNVCFTVIYNGALSWLGLS